MWNLNRRKKRIISIIAIALVAAMLVTGIVSMFFV